MTSHELAKKLLESKNYPVFVILPGDGESILDETLEIMSFEIFDENLDGDPDDPFILLHWNGYE